MTLTYDMALGVLIGFTATVTMFAMVTIIRSEGPVTLATPPLKGEKLVKIIYVLADMRGRGTVEATERLELVQQKFVHLLRLGMYPVAVGVNTEFSMRDFALPLLFEEAGKELAGRCDGIYLMPGYDQDPEGVSTFEYAKAKKLKVFTATEAHIQEKLKKWAAEP